VPDSQKHCGHQAEYQWERAEHLGENVELKDNAGRGKECQEKAATVGWVVGGGWESAYHWQGEMEIVAGRPPVKQVA
jgi:hypothetical protein